MLEILPALAHVSLGVSPPAGTEQNSAGLAGFDPDLSCVDSTQDYAVDVEHQPTDLVAAVVTPWEVTWAGRAGCVAP
jgi:hypothetical protein